MLKQEPSNSDAGEATERPSVSKRPAGRPRKAPGTKAKGITVTLWPSEIAALEQLRAEVNKGQAAEVPRSDLARLAFSLLLEMHPAKVRAELAKRRS